MERRDATRRCETSLRLCIDVTDGFRLLLNSVRHLLAKSLEADNRNQSDQPNHDDVLDQIRASVVANQGQRTSRGRSLRLACYAVKTRAVSELRGFAAKRIVANGRAVDLL